MSSGPLPPCCFKFCVILAPLLTIPSRAKSYEGHRWLYSPIWDFGSETATQALRLIGSGLFDEFPNLQVVLGHLGERIPFDKRQRLIQVCHEERHQGLRSSSAPEGKRNGNYQRCPNQGNCRALALHQIAALTSAFGGKADMLRTSSDVRF